MNENTNCSEFSLPFKDDFVLLAYYELCRRRLMGFYKYLQNDPEHLEISGKMFKEQLSLGIIKGIEKLVPKTRNQVK